LHKDALGLLHEHLLLRRLLAGWFARRLAILLGRGAIRACFARWLLRGFAGRWAGSFAEVPVLCRGGFDKRCQEANGHQRKAPVHGKFRYEGDCVFRTESADCEAQLNDLIQPAC
jgi:hypothetical protein